MKEESQTGKKYKKSQLTKERVMRSSVAIMTRKGYENTTIRDICNEAKVSIGTFYSYFKTKNDIFFANYKTADEYFTNTVAQIIIGRKATDKIIDFFRYYARLNVNTGVEMCKILFNPDNSWFVRHRPMQQVLENIIREGQDQAEIIDDMEAARIVDLLFILMRGCCYNWCIQNGNYDLELQMVDYLKTVLPALQKNAKAEMTAQSTTAK
jgi:TetR/AcrR family fatty acid metabolism transcriptional regulator